MIKQKEVDLWSPWQNSPKKAILKGFRNLEVYVFINKEEPDKTR